MKVFAETSDSGSQQEKFEALILRVKWNRGQIEDLLNRRISQLVQQQYTIRPVVLKELFPERVGRVLFLDYLLQRTAKRPRDAILFVNQCLSQSENLSVVKTNGIFEAEREYSAGRLIALQDEWNELYPSLTHCIPLLERTALEFKISSLNKVLGDQVIETLAALTGVSDQTIEAANIYLTSAAGSSHNVMASIFRMFYDVGLVGLRFEGGSTGAIWASESSAAVPGQIKGNTRVLIHPMFFQALHTYHGANT